MTEKYKTVSSKILFSNPYWDYYFEKYILPSGNEGDYHYVKSRGATMVVPLSSSNTFILTRQYRYLNQRFSIEFPGGGIKQGLTPIDNAKEELLEETGYSAGYIKKIGEFNPFNGVTNEICSIFAAKDLTLLGSKPEESEEIELIELTGKEIIELISRNEIWDGMTLAAWALFSNKQSEGD